MWRGVFPAVTTKFGEDGSLDEHEMERCFGIQIDAGVDSLARESLVMGAHGWVAGPVVALRKEAVAIWRLVQEGRPDEARGIYRWFRPLLDLDVSTNLVQNIKLADTLAIGSNGRVRMPLDGAERDRATAIVEAAPAARPVLPALRSTAWGGVAQTRRANRRALSSGGEPVHPLRQSGRCYRNEPTRSSLPFSMLTHWPELFSAWRLR